MAGDRVTTEHYGECPKCNSYGCDIWDTDGDYTIFCCCDCKITFDVLDESEDYHYMPGETQYAIWYYVENITTFDEGWDGQAPYGCCK